MRISSDVSAGLNPAWLRRKQQVISIPEVSGNAKTLTVLQSGDVEDFTAVVPQSDSSGRLNAQAVAGVLAQVRQEHRWCVCRDVQSVRGVPVLHTIVQDDSIGYKGRPPGHVYLTGADAVIRKTVWRTARH